MEAIAYWLINTPGIGAIIVIAIGLGVLIAYTLTVRWIQSAPPDPILITVTEPPPGERAGVGSNSPNGR